jgi:hypothetical protein
MVEIKFSTATSRMARGNQSARNVIKRWRKGHEEADLKRAEDTHVCLSLGGRLEHRGVIRGFRTVEAAGLAQG